MIVTHRSTTAGRQGLGVGVGEEFPLTDTGNGVVTVTRSRKAIVRRTARLGSVLAGLVAASLVTVE